jgi:hypothetical protein
LQSYWLGAADSCVIDALGDSREAIILESLQINWGDAGAHCEVNTQRSAERVQTRIHVNGLSGTILVGEGQDVAVFVVSPGTAGRVGEGL